MSRRPWREAIAYQLLSREREQHLPSVGCGHEPRYPVYRRSEIVPVSLLCGSCVQGHPHAYGSDLFGPALLKQRQLARKCRFRGVGGGAKGGAEGVPHRFEDVAVASLYGGPQQLVVAGEGFLHCLSVALPQPGRALYVSEQEGDGACWRATHFSFASYFPFRRTTL